MNIFVLCTPRSGSYTFAKACGHISNYTVTHEAKSRLLGKKRVVYPENHIEVDNRLAWFLGYLDEIYGDNAFYVHLMRDREKTAISINKRWNLPASIVSAYGRAILVRGDRQEENDLEVCEDYYDTVTKNIQLFLKDKSHKMVFSVENARENFQEFWQKIGAEGNLDLGLETWFVKHNASPKNKQSIQLEEMTKIPVVEITDIGLSGLNAEEIGGHQIDLPKKGDRLNTYSMEIVGWVVGKKSRVVAVEAVSGGKVLQKVPVELPRPGVGKRFPKLPAAKNSGFAATVGLLGLPLVSELTLQGVMEDGRRLPLGEIKFQRLEGLKSSYSPKLQPLVISSVGPSGAERLLQMLAEHPSLAAMGPSAGEMPSSQYWLELLLGLSPGKKMGERSELSYWWRRTYPEELADFCLQSIDGLYSKVNAKKSQINYFVENYDASRPEFFNLLSELYPEGREIILVRDFRDVVYSMLPFSGRKCGGFDPKRFKSYQQFVYEFCKYSVGGVLDRWKERRSSAYLVKYEDLILSPEETLSGILQYLDLDSSNKTVDRMLKKASKQKSKPEPPVGDWQYEMPASLQVLCSEVCAEALQEFGYE
ncbi:MAG: sulfotransferase [Cyanobacteriota bacterium]|nr:sulfotransferase [Cyanobacteriota bacterium]